MGRVVVDPSVDGGRILTCFSCWCEDEDGCMDPDNDNDFIPDVDDRCPLEAADEDNDEDEDGCTDR